MCAMPLLPNSRLEGRADIPVGEVCVDIVLQTTPRSGYTPDRNTQVGILEKLPETLIEDVKEYVKILAEKGDFSFQTVAKEEFIKIVKGRTNEIIGMIEFNPNTPTSFEILDVVQNPLKHNFAHEFDNFRIPDAAYVKTNEETGMLEIVSAGEFKTGWIDIRCMKQLQETGFKRTLTKLTELLNKPDEAIKHNLPEVAKFAGKIKMSETFETTLIIPADKDPSNILGIIDPKLNNQDQEKVYDFLKNIKIVNSHFSSDELTAVSSYVARQVLEKLAS